MIASWKSKWSPLGGAIAEGSRKGLPASNSLKAGSGDAYSDPEIELTYYADVDEYVQAAKKAYKEADVSGAVNNLEQALDVFKYLLSNPLTFEHELYAKFWRANLTLEYVRLQMEAKIPPSLKLLEDVTGRLLKSANSRKSEVDSEDRQAIRDLVVRVQEVLGKNLPGAKVGSIGGPRLSGSFGITGTGLVVLAATAAVAYIACREKAEEKEND